jgi:Protein of unknown function (DUF3313)
MIKIENSHRTFFNLLAAAGMLLSIVAAGCSTTVESQPEAANAVESGGPMPASVTSFFGPDASKLAPGTKGSAALIWVSSNAQWATYNKILLDPVQFWAAADSKVSTSDQQVLSEYFYNSLKTKIPQQGFALVDQPGSGVIRLQVALMDATTATPGLRTVSVVVPQARVLNLAQSMATDS